MPKTKAIILSFILFASIPSLSQPKRNKRIYIPPIANEFSLSGSFGEIRTDHFHSGIDIRTNGKRGLKVKVSDKGFVSRIKISTLGFGKALYVDHPNGTTTVYAHLDSFSPEIDKYVKNHQYKNQSFEVDLFLKPNEITVTKGSIIGASGNSGSSGGPHLHYETRSSKSQKPFNPLTCFNVIDRISPQVKAVHLYFLKDTPKGTNDRIPILLRKEGNNYLIDDTIPAYGNIGIGVEAFDLFNSTSTILGISSITLRVNGIAFYSLSLDEFAFGETRYANSIVDYTVRENTGKEIIKLWAEPNNLFSGIKQLINRGIIPIQANEIYRIDINVYDGSGNRSCITFYIRGIPSPASDTLYYFDEYTYNILRYDIDNIIDCEHFSLTIPKNTLYNDIPFSYSVRDSSGFFSSPIIHLGIMPTPLHRKVELKIRAKGITDNFNAKAYIGSFNKDKKEVIPLGGIWDNGFIKTSISNLGDFFVLLDTIPPVIQPVNFSSAMKPGNLQQLTFIIRDDQSGIKTFNGYIDGKWALFEYDPKNDELKYLFDPERIVKNSKHSLNLIITDERGNTGDYQCDFFW